MVGTTYDADDVFREGNWLKMMFHELIYLLIGICIGYLIGHFIGWMQRGENKK